MYKYTDNAQSIFRSFNKTLGLYMNPNDRCIKMSDAIPWDDFERKYAGLFKGKMVMLQNIASCACFIHHSDRELVEQLNENPYYQYFIVVTGY